MLGDRKLVLDTFCEVYDLLKPWADAEFWNLEEHITDGKLIPGAVYLISRTRFAQHLAIIRSLAEAGTILPVLSNPSEGSDTMVGQCHRYQIMDLLAQNRALIIAGGYMPDEYPYLYYENFLPKILDYEENVVAVQCSEEIYSKQQKPYKFLFLNGRARTHRKYLLERFRLNGLLDQSLWTNLDPAPIYPLSLRLNHNGHNLIDNNVLPVKFLPHRYEVNRYQDQVDKSTDWVDRNDHPMYAKAHLFKQEWGEIYINPEPYIDTYFSLVTETVYDYPHTFRTEKIWKPIAMGHPWIAVSNPGYYRDIHQLGFKTFGHVIDESFDQIDNAQDRIERVSAVVEDLCKQDLASFLKECYNTCKYNQQHLAEMSIKVRKEFPERFSQFIKKYQ